MLRWRLLLGAGLIAALAGLCWLDVYEERQGAAPGTILQPLAIAVGVLAAFETARLLTARQCPPQKTVLVLGTVAIVGLATRAQMLAPQSWPGLSAPATALGLSIVAALVVEVLRYRGGQGAIARLCATSFGLLYAGFLFSFLVELRFVRPGAQGLLALLSVLFVVKFGDTGAYTVGRLIGRNKMAPHLSPGKTWEGLAGGLVASCFGAWLALGPLHVAMVGGGPARIVEWLSYGVAVGLAGVLGDLAESLLKREAGVKDSSTWMPGFGGVLDLVDSLLLSAPIAWVFWHLGWVGS